MSALGQATLNLGDRRRALLKDFLTMCRSRLTPSNVGLPETPRRRVPGLRRDEVAELVGVSSDWYRWFESGRSIRVSVQFLAKLSQVLRLSPHEQISLYHLAFPEVYQAYVAQSEVNIPLVGSREDALSVTAA